MHHQFPTPATLKFLPNFNFIDDLTQQFPPITNISQAHYHFKIIHEIHEAGIG